MAQRQNLDGPFIFSIGHFSLWTVQFHLETRLKKRVMNMHILPYNKIDIRKRVRKLSQGQTVDNNNLRWQDTDSYIIHFKVIIFSGVQADQAFTS